MVGKQEICDIRVQGGVNNFVAKVKLIKFSESFKTNCQNTLVHTST